MKKRVDILIEGQPVDLYPNTSFTLERYNPVFDFGTVQGSKVYRFTVPFSPTNNRIFQYAQDPQSVSDPKVYYTEKIADGDLIEKGYTYLEKITNTGYEISFGSNLGDFFGDYQDVPLNLIPFGSEALPSSIASLSTEKLDGAGKLMYCLPTILNSQFYGTNIVDGFNGKVNEYASGSYLSTAPLVPMFSLHWVLRRLGELCGFRVQGEFMDDPAAKRLILYNTFALSGERMEYRNHLPSDLSVRTLFLALKLPPFGVTSFFDVQRKIITLRYTESCMATPTRLDLTTRTLPPVLPGNILDRRIELDWELDSDDGLMKTVPAALEKYTAAEYNQETLFSLRGKFSTLLMDSSGLPITEQNGITALTGQMEKKFKPRLLYWHGLVGGAPVAKNEYGDQRLSFHGSNNLRERFWKRYETFRSSTFPASPSVLLNSSELARLDFHRNAGEEMALHIRGVDYFVQAIKATLPLSSPALLEVYKR